MPNPIVFFVKNRPQDSDAWPIAKEEKVVFLGYPPWRDAGQRDSDMRSGYAAALFDISTEPGCAALLTDQTRGYRAQVSQNANLVAAVIPGSFVIVPRPEAGVCHLARVDGRFTVVDAPKWGKRYLDLRQHQGLGYTPAAGYLGDVVQCWHVDEWKTVSFPLVPRWIAYRLLSRNTAGLIYGFQDLGLEPHERVQELLQGRGELRRPEPTTAALLAEWISPSAFEHLVVHLLQLEAVAGEQWHHVGGSGDGGVDGLAVSAGGDVVGALQCKWHYQGDVAALGSQLAERIRSTWPRARIVVAVLLSPNAGRSSMPDGVTHLGLQELAALVEQHRETLPVARTLGLVR